MTEVTGNQFWYSNMATAGDLEPGIHMPKWYRPVSPNSTVAWAVDDAVWQMFRGARLRGVSTSKKLELLNMWETLWRGTEYYHRALEQYYNYLDSLKRGGFVKYEGTARELRGTITVVK